MPQIELDLGRSSTPSTTSPTSRPSMKIAQSKQKFRRQSKNRFPPAIRLVSPVEPAPTRNRTLLDTTYVVSRSVLFLVGAGSTGETRRIAGGKRFFDCLLNFCLLCAIFMLGRLVGLVVDGVDHLPKSNSICGIGHVLSPFL